LEKKVVKSAQNIDESNAATGIGHRLINNVLKVGSGGIRRAFSAAAYLSRSKPKQVSSLFQ